MKYIFVCVCCLIIVQFSFSQQNHFIYIQTENNQPFYLKTGSTLYNSTFSGYLIVPKLIDGEYKITIGFPKNKWPEQSASITIDKKDGGYLLKNFGDKGWGLFNLQSLQMVTMGTNIKPGKGVTEETKDDFSNLLAAVVNDPSIRLASIEKREELVIGKPIDNGIIANKSIEPIKNELIVNKEGLPPVTLIKKEMIAGNEMFYTYIVKQGEQTDTVDIRITSEVTGNKQEERKAEEAVDLKGENNQNNSNPAGGITPDTLVAKTEVLQDKISEAQIIAEAKKIDDSLPLIEDLKDKEAGKKDGDSLTGSNAIKNVNDQAVSGETSLNVNASKPALKISNSDCKANATDEDFLRLRKKMASENQDEKMLSLAKKSFKARCFTCEQVKNLSVLFLKDEGKYAFFDLAYPFVSDSQNFPSLEPQLSDTYFISRFKAMIRH